jgi:histone-lysine N-methyltransferase SETMAR
MVEFMQQGNTVTSDMYCKALKNLRRAIQNKKLGMLTSGIVLLHNNIGRLTAARNRALLEHFNWELFDRPSYSPDLAPSDYHPFTYLKNWLRSQRFSTNEKLMEGVETCLSSQVAESFDTGIKKLVPPYDKFFSSSGDYVEK